MLLYCYVSIFVEKELGPILIGIDYVTNSLETEEASSLKFLQLKQIQ